jgi:hypothetical protein
VELRIDLCLQLRRGGLHLLLQRQESSGWHFSYILPTMKGYILFEVQGPFGFRVQNKKTAI